MVNTSSAALRVGLPYTFIRHGIEIRVNAIEFDNQQQLLVNLTLEEKRGSNADLSTDHLLEARAQDGHPLRYVHVIRGNHPLPDSSIQMTPHQEAQVSLVFEPVALSTATVSEESRSVEVHFPTGKWWSSSIQE